MIYGDHFSIPGRKMSRASGLSQMAVHSQNQLKASLLLEDPRNSPDSNENMKISFTFFCCCASLFFFLFIRRQFSNVQQLLSLMYANRREEKTFCSAER
jgi:hypothetical protein